MEDKETSIEKTLLGLFRKALEFQAAEVRIEYKDGNEEIFAVQKSFRTEIGRLKSEESCLFRKYLHIAKKPMIIGNDSDKYQFTVEVYKSFGEDAFRIRFERVV